MIENHRYDRNFCHPRPKNMYFMEMITNFFLFLAGNSRKKVNMRSPRARNFCQTIFYHYCSLYHILVNFVFLENLFLKSYKKKKKMIFIKKRKKWSFFPMEIFRFVCLLCANTTLPLRKSLNIIFRPMRIF